MSNFLRVSFLLVLVAGGALAIAGSMFLTGDTLANVFIFIAVAIVFGLLAYVWHVAEQRQAAPGTGLSGGYVVGLVAGVAVTVYFAYLGVVGATQLVRIALFGSGSTITNYSETPIAWDGFDGPIGVRVAFDIEYPLSLRAQFRSPRLLVGGSPPLDPEGNVETYWKYCDQPVTDGVACMMVPLWPLEPLPGVPKADSAHLAFDLYPSNLVHFESPERVCLRRRQPYTDTPPAGDNTLALWTVAAGEISIDLSLQLDAAARAHGGMLTDAAGLRELLERAQSDGLQAAGYQVCEIKSAIRFSEQSECYCRD